jgi:hypothetical protein
MNENENEMNETEATMEATMENETDETEGYRFNGPFGDDWELEIEMDLLALRAVNGGCDENDE